MKIFVLYLCLFYEYIIWIEQYAKMWNQNQIFIFFIKQTLLRLLCDGERWPPLRQISTIFYLTARPSLDVTVESTRPHSNRPILYLPPYWFLTSVPFMYNLWYPSGVISSSKKITLNYMFIFPNLLQWVNSLGSEPPPIISECS